MRLLAIICVVTALWTVSPWWASAEGGSRKGTDSSPSVDTSSTSDEVTADSLDNDDRLSLIAAALDTKGRIRSERDCSHLVHSIYERAGFPFTYASSSDIYAGIDAFERVKQPQPGDLVVWRGHVGIVVKPSQHLFFSYLTSGPGVDDYDASYWRKRGHARFYRYVRSDCDTCNFHRLVKVKR